MCVMNQSRGSIPTRFALDSCVDGETIWLRDQLKAPVRFTVSGDVRTPVRVNVDHGFAALATRAAYPDRQLLLPSDKVRLPIGASAASVTLGSASDVGGFYVLAVTLVTFLPGPPAKDIYEAYNDLAKRTFDAYGRYRDCLVGKNYVGQIGCKNKLTFAITVAVTMNSVKLYVAATKSRPGQIIKLLLDSGTYALFLSGLSGINNILGSDKTISQSAAAPTLVNSTDPPDPADPGTTDPDPGTTDPSTDDPCTDDSSTDSSSTDDPYTDSSSTDDPYTDSSSTDDPYTDDSSTDPEPSWIW
jgi:hypothetical protein